MLRIKIEKGTGVSFAYDIEDKLIPIIRSIIEHQTFPDDDGMTEVNIIDKNKITPELYVKAKATLDRILSVAFRF